MDEIISMIEREEQHTEKGIKERGFDSPLPYLYITELSHVRKFNYLYLLFVIWSMPNL